VLAVPADDQKNDDGRRPAALIMRTCSRPTLHCAKVHCLRYAVQAAD
jgi:hypothetical protein